MSDFIQFVYRTGSPALILGVIVFGIYKIVVYFFDRYFEIAKGDIQKDIENYKKELENEKQAFIYSLQKKQLEDKTQLDQLLHEHHTQFTTLYNERNRVLNQLFGSLVDYLNKYEELTKCIREMILDSLPTRNIWDIEKELHESHEIAMKIYDPNKLYLNRKLSNKIRYYIEGVRESSNQHFFFLGIFDKNETRDIVDDYEFHGVVLNNYKLRYEELDEIELEFRKILGVE